jgi:myo-inositol 2-dehydrogenase / D-chiro-inositol 1-dehydrogenase
MFNVALFGAGRIGQIHARNAAARSDLKLKYIVDPNGEAADPLAQRTGAVAVDSDAALGDASISGVIIASATNAHLDQALRAAAAGKTIFCEKPLDLDLERARNAASQLERAAMLMGFNRRFDPHFQALKTRLDEGAIGRLESLSIVSHDPAPPPIEYVRISGGLFKDMAIHDFDTARWLMGEDPEEVFTSASCLIDPAIAGAGDVDTAKTILRTATGRLSSATAVARPTAMISGSKPTVLPARYVPTTSWKARSPRGENAAARAMRFRVSFLTGTRKPIGGRWRILPRSSAMKLRLPSVTRMPWRR